MRLGKYPCYLKKGSLSLRAYGNNRIFERHRHRYELNDKYRPLLEKKGLKTSGVYLKENLVEMVELSCHPWFIGCQFHPEFQSKPDKAHPLFRDFIKAAMIFKDKKSTFRPSGKF